MITDLVLDWAGTLADDLDWTLEATNRTLRHFGGEPVDRDTYRREFTIPVDGFYASRVPGHTVAAIDDVFFRHYAAIADRVELFAGVADMLAIAGRRGLRLFVLSTVQTAIIRRILERHGLAAAMHEVVGDAADKRPALAALLERHGCIRDQTLVVGDSTHDLEAARTCGTRSGAALWGYSPPAKLQAAAPDYALADVAALMAQLDRDWLLRSVPLVIATVGGILVRDDGKLLLVQTRKWSDTWGIPGGKIQYGETMQAAYEREILEETGLVATDTAFLMIQDCIESPEFVQKRHFLLINYVSRVSGAAKVVHNYEIDATRWVTVDEALGMRLNAPTRLAIDAARCNGMFDGRKR